VRKLEAAGLFSKQGEKRPHEYEARDVSLTLTSEKGIAQTITPALIAVVAHRNEDEDLDIYIERHGLGGLAAALDYALQYVEGTVTHRIMARELDISPLEAEIVLQALEPIARTYSAE
jgi:hypothetical protein